MGTTLPTDTTGYLTISQIRRLYGWGSSRLYRLARIGQIDSIAPPGRATMFREADIQALIQTTAA